MLNTVIFDLDGTLLPLDQDQFVKVYFGLLTKRFEALGYEKALFFKHLWMGTTAMIQNTGKMTNEEIFYETFFSLTSVERDIIKQEFMAFYETDFDEVKHVTTLEPLSKICLDALKQKGYTLILATNPLFPQVATHKRIKWAGLEPEDFIHVTTFENSSYCKPNLKYYEAILESFGKRPEECLMVGNDVKEDMCCARLNMETFLLKDCLLNVDNEDTSGYKQGSFQDLYDYIQSLPKIK